MDYDPLSGSPLPSYFTDSGLPQDTPITGDSGYSYGKDVLDLLKYGVGQVFSLKNTEVESKLRYDLGRAGLTPLGQPAGLVLGGSVISPAVLILGAAAVLGLALVLRK